ncbi:peptidoglycan hydrolase [Rhodocaloribacter litoris]|uniref:peptidoglycan hydrolase n=1 Tax=Rhodocaloribacter litoris TaxID=2558931 RepID=UPI00141FFDF1|nr:peptidoglycan hydrolase [Rhodocaloribacter litoris]QXD16016.1 peptidoglycan hydrolase [Rhodocaloribacter litoris]GIV59742.1 MAG: hypothetical protein KatS3mg043_0831 [Rhodothermaceae bacterium]
MKIHDPLPPLPGFPGANPRRPSTPEEAARQFEHLLARQLAHAMTDGLFKTGLAGENGPGWMASYQQTQRDVLTDVLAKHLVEQGALRLTDLLTRRWNLRGATDPAAPETTTNHNADTP